MITTNNDQTLDEWIGICYQVPHGGWIYRNDAYRLEFNADGCLLSLQVSGHDFLRACHGDRGGGSFFADGKRVPVSGMTGILPEGDFMIGDSVYGLSYRFSPDRMQFNLGQENFQGVQEYVLFPAEGITISTVTDADPDGRQTIRLTDGSGNWLEIHHHLRLVDDYHGVPALVIDTPYRVGRTGEMRFAAVGAPATARVEMRCAVADHYFPAGQPIAITGIITPQDMADGPLMLRLRLLDFNTREVLWEEQQTVEVTDNTPLEQAWRIPWTTPGVYPVQLIACRGQRVFGEQRAVIVYDLEHFTPPLYKPRDFRRFWQRAIGEQRALPLDPVLIKDDDASTTDYTIYTVYVTGHHGRRLRGRYGEPVKPGCYPVVISSANAADPTICTLGFEMDGMATYRTGLGNRFTSNFFHVYLDALRWVDFLAVCEKVDLNRSLFASGSRGGPIGIAVLALDPRVKLLTCNVPTCNRWDWQVRYPATAGGWGPKPTDCQPGQSLDAFTHELSYFDASNFADMVTQSVLIGFGLLDGLSQANGNLACFTRLAGPKKLCLNPWEGHTDANSEWHDTAAAWRKELFGDR